MSGHTNLFRRGAVYYYRSRVPNDLLKALGKSEVKFSLKTKDHKEAIKRVRIEAAKVELMFAKHRQSITLKAKPLSETLTPDFLKQIEEVVYWSLLYTDEDLRVHGIPTGDGTRAPLHKQFDEYSDTMSSRLHDLKGAFARGDLENLIPTTVWYLNTYFDASVNNDSPEVRTVAREIQKGFLRAQEAIQSRNQGNRADTPAAPQSRLSDSPVESGDVPLLSEVVSKWVEDKSRVSWTPQTSRDHQRWVSAFISVSGDKPFNSYRKADAMAFKSLLLKLPANWSKKAAFKGMDIAKAAESAQLLGLEPMSSKNARKVFQYVGSLWRWLFAHYDELEKNIFEGITIEAHSDKRKERDSFTIDDLNTIFSSSLYTGCKSEGRLYQSGSHSMKGTAKFWVPLIALYSGARMGEILQLYPSDIKEENGIHYFDFNADGDDKTLKTRTSERKVPIHQMLITLASSIMWP